ncbi:MAG TPA: hypothetical protein VMV18_04110, partial [bacterium]|nr:hypothetical protein [bacterium]
MASVFRSVRRRLDAMPLWGVIAIDAVVLGLWLIDFRIPDEIPVDKVLLGGVFLASGVYAWRRYFGPPGALSAAARRKVAEIELLFDECRKASETIPGAAGEVARLAELLGKVQSIEQRLEQTETVLLSPQYDVAR